MSELISASTASLIALTAARCTCTMSSSDRIISLISLKNLSFSFSRYSKSAGCFSFLDTAQVELLISSFLVSCTNISKSTFQTCWASAHQAGRSSSVGQPKRQLLTLWFACANGWTRLASTKRDLTQSWPTV
jgi:hypothetical protein